MGFAPLRQIVSFDAALFSNFDCLCPVINRIAKKRLQIELGSNNLSCYVLTTDDTPERLVGFFTLKNKSLVADKDFKHPEQDELISQISHVSCVELAHFGVDKSFQKQGVGALLLALAERQYSTLDMQGMLLHLISSPNFCTFYEKFGYLPMQETDEHKRGAKPYLKTRNVIFQSISGDIEVRGDTDEIEVDYPYPQSDVSIISEPRS